MVHCVDNLGDYILSILLVLLPLQDLELSLEDIAYPIRGKHFQIIARALIDNAFKLSADKTPVVISLQMKNERVYFEVTDTGRGMPRSQIERIQAFQQFNRDKHEQQGLGLGLELCQRLLEVLKAAIPMCKWP